MKKKQPYHDDIHRLFGKSLKELSKKELNRLDDWADYERNEWEQFLLQIRFEQAKRVK